MTRFLIAGIASGTLGLLCLLGGIMNGEIATGIVGGISLAALLPICAWLGIRWDRASAQAAPPVDAVPVAATPSQQSKLVDLVICVVAFGIFLGPVVYYWAQGESLGDLLRGKRTQRDPTAATGEAKRLQEKYSGLQRQIADKRAEFSPLATRPWVPGWSEVVPTGNIPGYGPQYRDLRHPSVGPTPADNNRFDTLLSEITVLERQLAALENEARQKGVPLRKLPTCDQCRGYGQDPRGIRLEWERDRDGNLTSKRAFGWSVCGGCDGRGVLK